MAGNRFESGRIEVNGGTAYPVRVVEDGVITVNMHCNSLDEAKQVAEKEADRLQVSIEYRHVQP